MFVTRWLRTLRENTHCTVAGQCIGACGLELGRAQSRPVTMEIICLHQRESEEAMIVLVSDHRRMVHFLWVTQTFSIMWS